MVVTKPMPAPVATQPATGDLDVSTEALHNAAHNPTTDTLTLFTLPAKHVWSETLLTTPMLSGMAMLGFATLAGTEYPLVFASATHKSRK